MATYSGGYNKQKHPVLVIGEIGLVRSLIEMKVPIYAGTETTQNIAAYSRHIKQSFFFSQFDSEEFIDELCELGYYFKKKPVILSDDDRAILNISENRDRLKAYYLFLYPERETVDKILDKQRFKDLAKQHELPIPVTYQPDSYNDVEKVAMDIKYPCIVKPTQRHFWWGEDFIEKMGGYKKAFKCSNLYQFRETCQKISEINPNMVIQEYVEGNDRQHFSSNLFVDEKGRLQGYYIAQKKRIYPIEAGTGTYIQTLDNPEVFKISLEIIEKLKLKGLVNIQFKRDSRTNEYKLLEIHARNSLWSLLGAKAGANLAILYYQYLVYGLQYEKPVQAKPNVKYLNLLKDIRALIAYREKGELSVAEWWKSLQGERIFAALSWSDPVPIMFKILHIVFDKAKRSLKKRLPLQKGQRYDSIAVRKANSLLRF